MVLDTLLRKPKSMRACTVWSLLSRYTVVAQSVTPHLQQSYAALEVLCCAGCACAVLQRCSARC